MTIIMYHYVRNMAETAYPQIKGLTIEKFIKQLDFIEKNYTVISLEDYLALLCNKKDIPANPCVLTFDDGFKDHYRNVFPILRERNLRASFFPLTQPLLESKVASVHKAHFLLAKLGSKIFAQQFNKTLKSKFPHLFEKFLIDNKEKKQRKYRWDDVLTANLKYSISAMPFEPKTEILNHIFAQHFENEKSFAQELYLSPAEIKEMLETGMSFGGHTHTHPALSKLTQQEQTREIANSKTILENALGIKINSFSYPYGDFNETTLQVLKEQGYACGLTTDVGINDDRGVNPLTLKRLDTNDLAQ